MPLMFVRTDPFDNKAASGEVIHRHITGQAITWISDDLVYWRKHTSVRHGSVVMEWLPIVCINYSIVSFREIILSCYMKPQVEAVFHVINICDIFIQMLKLHFFLEGWISHMILVQEGIWWQSKNRLSKWNQRLCPITSHLHLSRLYGKHSGTHPPPPTQSTHSTLPHLRTQLHFTIPNRGSIILGIWTNLNHKDSQTPGETAQACLFSRLTWLPVTQRRELTSPGNPM